MKNPKNQTRGLELKPRPKAALFPKLTASLLYGNFFVVADKLEKNKQN
jgi:hypothetical protein